MFTHFHRIALTFVLLVAVGMSVAHGQSAATYYSMADTTGSRQCLQQGVISGNSTTYTLREGSSSASRTLRDHDVKRIRNLCAHSVSYRFNTGAEGVWNTPRIETFTIGPNETHDWTCYYVSGANAFGTIVTNQSYCTR